MKLAVIAPATGYNIVDRLGVGMHMVLAQWLERGNEHHVPMANDHYWRKARNGHYVIVDNGIAEDSPVPFNDVVSMANAIHASEVVLPDIIHGHWRDSVKATIKDAYKVPVPRRMAVVHGTSWEEWRLCVRNILTEIDIGCLGISRGVMKFAGKYARVEALAHLKQMGVYDKVSIHLLGAREGLWNEILMMRSAFPMVRSLDTAAPFAWAQHEMHLANGGEERHYSMDWENPNFHEAIADDNLRALLDRCGG